LLEDVVQVAEGAGAAAAAHASATFFKPDLVGRSFIFELRGAIDVLAIFGP